MIVAMNNARWATIVLLVLTTIAQLTSTVNATLEELETRKQRATAPSHTAPAGWKVSWTSSKRLSTGSSTGFLSQSVVDTSASTVTQKHVEACINQCASQTRCGFSHLLKLSSSKRASVVCLLYQRYITSSKVLTANAPAVYGGKVSYSYGIRSTCAPTSGKGLTCTPNKVGAAAPKTTTTTSTVPTSTAPIQAIPTSTLKLPFRITNDSTLPATRKGATLIDWVPDACSKANLTVPAMINGAFLNGTSSATTAYVSQHGAGSDFDAYFTYLYNVVGDNVPLISAGFMPDDKSNEFYRPGINLAWDSRGDSWVVGEDDTTGATCSSYDMYDTILDYLDNSGYFPKVKTIYFVGHSGGGNMVNRFSAINTNNPFTVKYVVANAANQAYFTDDRPVDKSATDADSVSAATCAVATHWPYQWTGKTNRYVGKRFSGNVAQLFTRWRSRSVVHLTGDMDIDTSGTQSCQSRSQGGYYRRDRNYAYWAYQNILAGTKTDVSAYYGYSDLLKNGAKQITSSSEGFNHFQCTVSGVGHDANAMYRSACGQAAIFGKTLPNGAGASYPPGTLQSDRNSTSSSGGLLDGLLPGSLGTLGSDGGTQDVGSSQDNSKKRRAISPPSKRFHHHYYPQTKLF